MRYKLNEMQLSGNSQIAKLSRDATAMLELLNEHEKTHVRMSFSKARAGRANLEKKQFTIPLTAQAHFGLDYMMYYVIHEFTHCLGYHNHRTSFKHKEQQLCELFGYKLEYKKAYPRRIYANGQIIYQSKERK
jgi:hypothetical protein